MLRTKELQALLESEVQDAAGYVRNIMVVTLDGGIMASAYRPPHDRLPVRTDPHAALSAAGAVGAAAVVAQQQQQQQFHNQRKLSSGASSNATTANLQRGTTDEPNNNDNSVEQQEDKRPSSSALLTPSLSDASSSTARAETFCQGVTPPWPVGGDRKDEAAAAVSSSSAESGCLLLPSSSILSPPQALQTAYERLQTLAAMLVCLFLEFSSFAERFGCLSLDCENGRACVGSLNNGALLLCLWATPDAPYGALHLKFERLYSGLSAALRDLY